MVAATGKLTHSNTMAQILVIAAHPHMEHSRVTRSLLQAAAAAGPRVVVRDLYTLYPD